MTDRDIHDFWETLGARYRHASTADPNDRLGHKNAYIAALRDHYMLQGLAAVPAGAIVVDFGCGEGGLSRTLVEAGYYAVGLDIVESLLRLAVEQDGGDKSVYVRYDGNSLPLSSQSCDAMVVYGVMIYLDDGCLADMLREMQRVLRPEGTLIMIEQCRSTTRTITSHHKTQRAQEAWMTALQAADFDVLQNEVCRHGHFPSTYLIRYGLWPIRWWRFAMAAERMAGRWFGILPADYADVMFVAKSRSTQSVKAS